MKLPTIRLRHKTRRDVTIKVNQADYARDLGQSKYAGWEIDGGERHNEAEAPIEVKPLEIEALPDEKEQTNAVQQEPKEEASAPRAPTKKAVRR